MTNCTHDVVVWVGTREGETNLFTLTSRNAQGNCARLLEVQDQVAAAKFVEHYRETRLTKKKAEERKAVLKAQYKNQGYSYRPRKALPYPM